MSMHSALGFARRARGEHHKRIAILYGKRSRQFVALSMSIKDCCRTHRVKHRDVVSWGCFGVKRQRSITVFPDADERLKECWACWKVKGNEFSHCPKRAT